MENCQELYQSEPKVQVTPIGIWPIATAGEVNHHGKSLGVLPIVRIYLCPATVTVNKSEFPLGVILLNDSPPPNNMATYDFRYVRDPTGSQQVFLMNNAGWPWCNKVALWE